MRPYNIHYIPNIGGSQVGKTMVKPIIPRQLLQWLCEPLQIGSWKPCAELVQGVLCALWLRFLSEDTKLSLRLGAQTLACLFPMTYGDGSKPWYLVNPKIVGKWMFIPLKCIYRYWPIPIYEICRKILSQMPLSCKSQLIKAVFLLVVLEREDLKITPFEIKKVIVFMCWTQIIETSAYPIGVDLYWFIVDNYWVFYL